MKVIQFSTTVIAVVGIVNAVRMTPPAKADNVLAQVEQNEEFNEIKTFAQKLTFKNLAQLEGTSTTPS